MIALNEIVRSLTAAWLLFIDRAGAVKLFDSTVDGFWRSFQAVLLLIPFYAVSMSADTEAYLALQASGEIAPFDMTAYYAGRIVSFGIDWVALPLLLAAIGPAIGIQGRYSAYIVARNWGAVLVSVPFALVSLLELAGLFPGESILFPFGITLAISLRYSYIAARRALEVPIDVAIGFVVLDFLLSFAIARIVGLLFAVPF